MAREKSTRMGTTGIIDTDTELLENLESMGFDEDQGYISMKIWFNLR